MILENLFPTPIAFFDYPEDLTEKQKQFLQSQPQHPNEGNSTSDDRYVLKHKELYDLTNFFDKCVHEYFMATVCPKHDTRLRITQSWLNWTKPGQFHHKHAHPNSFISGSFYVSADKDVDKVFFYRDEYKQIKFPPAEWNVYNSDSWWYPVKTGTLILFPSHLTHMVRIVEGEHTRVSLAFNTFPVGYVGNEEELTALHLEK